jgi:hypothetical protein
VESITFRLDKADERISVMEDKVKEILYSEHNKEKIKNKYEHNFQEF